MVHQLAQRFALAHKALHEIGGAGDDLRVESFDRDGSSSLGVGRALDRAHAATAQLRVNAISVLQGCAYHVESSSSR